MCRLLRARACITESHLWHCAPAVILLESLQPPHQAVVQELCQQHGRRVAMAWGLAEVGVEHPIRVEVPQHLCLRMRVCNMPC